MHVDPEKVHALLQRILGLPTEQRLPELERECGGDVALRQEVIKLLNSSEVLNGTFANLDVHSSGFLVQPLPDTQDSPRKNLELGLGPEQRLNPPEFVGRNSVINNYLLIRKLGQGGMGEVWLAQQSQPVKRRVALKLIKKGMDSEAVLARFEQERQALAIMDHPNIARVYDGGVSPNGQPYFVMELVDGQPLTKFSDDAKLTPRQRLELFVPICNAIQHAHQKGVIHRDLKPANILITMVDGRPVPKVIDFGVAKATGGKLTDQSLMTQFGAVIGTLE